MTLAVDLSKSDLMLESELMRFAEPAEAAAGKSKESQQRYQVTPASLRAALEQGLTGQDIEEWFRRRTGEPTPAAVSLLIHGASGSSISAHETVVISVPDPVIADGLLQHPETAGLFENRLGPQSLSVPRQSLDRLREVLSSLGTQLTLANGTATGEKRSEPAPAREEPLAPG